MIEDDTLSVADALPPSTEGELIVELMARFNGKMLISCLDIMGSQELVSVGMRNVGTHNKVPLTSRLFGKDNCGLEERM